MRNTKAWLAFAGRLYLAYLGTALVFGLAAVLGSAVYAFPGQTVAIGLGVGVGAFSMLAAVHWRRSVLRHGSTPRFALRHAIIVMGQISSVWGVHRHIAG